MPGILPKSFVVCMRSIGNFRFGDPFNNAMQYKSTTTTTLGNQFIKKPDKPKQIEEVFFLYFLNIYFKSLKDDKALYAPTMGYKAYKCKNLVIVFFF